MRAMTGVQRSLRVASGSAIWLSVSEGGLLVQSGRDPEYADSPVPHLGS